MKRLGALLAVAVILGQSGPRAQAVPRSLHVLSANVGNVNLNCQGYVFKLCLQPVEARAAAAIAELRPDVAVLIEVLPDGWCADQTEVVPTSSCAGRDAAFSQATTLLGDDYDYRCDQRFGWDCVAVRRSIGRFTSGVTTAPPIEGCDPGFTVNSVDLSISGRPLQVLAGHPDSGDDACRAGALQRLFDSAGRAPILLAGDFNLDPYREDSASVALWKQYVGQDRRYTPHNDDAYTSVPAEASQLDPTGVVATPIEAPMPAGPLARRTIDHVASDGFGGGECGVIRIDGGGGMDHRALDCQLEFPH